MHANEDDEEYCDWRANHPDDLVDVVTHLQEAEESGVMGASPFSPSISQSVDSALKRAASLLLR